MLGRERLRRARAVALARKHLGAALDTFLRLGAQPWADRARNELRATGANAFHTLVFGVLPQVLPGWIASTSAISAAAMMLLILR